MTRGKNGSEGIGIWTILGAVIAIVVLLFFVLSGDSPEGVVI